MKPLFIITSLLLTFFLCSINTYSAPYSQLGVNLVDQGAFINIMNHTNRFQKVESFDENGWPESDFQLTLMDHRPAQEWNNDIDDPEIYRIDYSGTYKCSFKGQAVVEVLWSNAYVNNLIFNEQTNTTYFDLVLPGPPEDGHGFIYMQFSNTTRTVDGPENTGITELKVMRPGYELNTTQIFTDEYIALCKSANFACFRYYTLLNIWGGEPTYPEKTLWDNRKSPLDATQQPMTKTNGKRDAWCWEYIIELANTLKKDIWICIHISCDSNYVVELAEMLKDELNPVINIYIENSNEVWSPTHMTHGPYNKAQADEYGITFDENYARRTVDLSNWFSQVFGQNEINNRIRVILAGQHAYLGKHDPHLNFINDNFGPPKNYVYALSTALYFGSTKADGSVIEINEGMIEDIDEQINNPEKSGYRQAHIDKADEWELPGGCTSYEGGPGVPGGGSKENLDNKINAHRTETMKDIMKRNFAEGWFDIVGGLALQFTLAGSYNRYGCWGLTDDYTKPDRNYKMQAMRELIGEWQDPINISGGFLDNKVKIYPNPFSESAIIEFEIEKPGYVAVEIYNHLGIKMSTLLNTSMNSGVYNLTIDGEFLPTGIYHLIVMTRYNNKTKKLLLIK
ncbi:T9SS type A sorting domain-containing protein [Bacteroidota bacterium]